MRLRTRETPVLPVAPEDLQAEADLAAALLRAGRHLRPIRQRPGPFTAA
jgi:hypothetical protein